MNVAPVSVEDTPESVVRLLKSYDPARLLWAERDHRHLIVVAVLTRGNEQAKAWLWSVLTREEVRELVPRSLLRRAGTRRAAPAIGLDRGRHPDAALSGLGTERRLTRFGGPQQSLLW
jgi:hypothetical protein